MDDERESYLVEGTGKTARNLVAATAWILSFVFLCFICSRFVGVKYGTLIGLVLWIIAVTQTIRVFLVSVPEITGLNVVNVLKSSKIPYGTMSTFLTGLGIKYPWEHYNLPSDGDGHSSFIDLRSVVQAFIETAPSKDGITMIAAGTVVYRPIPRLLPKHVTVSDTVIKQQLVAIATGKSAQEIFKYRSEIVKKQTQKIEKALKDHFEVAKTSGLDGSKSLEELYAVDVLEVTLADVDYSAEFTDALTARATMSVVQEAVNRLINENHIDPQKALDLAMMLLRPGSVEKKIFAIEGLDPNLAHTLGSMFKDGADIARSVRGGGKKRPSEPKSPKA